MRRYAIYYAPEPGSALAAFGARWLGRDPETGRGVEQPAVPGIRPERLVEITAAPRHYGFHGTLKAPIQLAQGRDAASLRDAVRDLARRQRPFEVDLTLASIGGFLALIPAMVSAGLDALAAACVVELDPFRAPLTDADRARRRPERLSERQRAHLEEWGYPYVFEEFGFHLTLTDRLPQPEHDEIKAILQKLTAEFCARPLRVESLCVFEQARRDEPFTVTARFPLGASA